MAGPPALPRLQTTCRASPARGEHRADFLCGRCAERPSHGAWTPRAAGLHPQERASVQHHGQGDLGHVHTRPSTARMASWARGRKARPSLTTVTSMTTTTTTLMIATARQRQRRVDAQPLLRRVGF
eukprot:scaffold2397_cov113-Isochrysis_galbana.AAC.4